MSKTRTAKISARSEKRQREQRRLLAQGAADSKIVEAMNVYESFARYSGVGYAFSAKTKHAVGGNSAE